MILFIYIYIHIYNFFIWEGGGGGIVYEKNVLGSKRARKAYVVEWLSNYEAKGNINIFSRASRAQQHTNLKSQVSSRVDKCAVGWTKKRVTAIFGGRTPPLPPRTPPLHFLLDRKVHWRQEPDSLIKRKVGGGRGAFSLRRLRYLSSGLPPHTDYTW